MEALQRAIASKLNLKPIDINGVEVVVGLDVAYSKKYGGVGVAVAYDITKGRVITWSAAVGEPAFPYIPGFLAFREAPVLYAAILELEASYDAIIVDGHGIAHPRRAGIASHIGAALGKPSIGVAKKRLVGKEVKENEMAYLVHLGEKVAIVIEHGRRRLYVSPGCCINLESAYMLVKRLLKTGFSLPLPTYYADKISKELARKLDRGALRPHDVRKELSWLKG